MQAGDCSVARMPSPASRAMVAMLVAACARAVPRPVSTSTTPAQTMPRQISEARATASRNASFGSAMASAAMMTAV